MWALWPAREENHCPFINSDGGRPGQGAAKLTTAGAYGCSLSFRRGQEIGPNDASESCFSSLRGIELQTTSSTVGVKTQEV